MITDRVRSDVTQHRMAVGEIAEMADVSSSAVRFYEAHGLIESIRTSTNQRRFAPEASCRIRVARVAQRVGLTVREIADVFATLPQHPEPADWDSVSATLVAEAHRRIDALSHTLADLDSATPLCQLPRDA
ncbi:hypothetical protein GCM10009624_01570 [Gordonia sinesedis]